MVSQELPPPAAAAAALLADPARVAAARRIQPSPDTRRALDQIAGLAARLLGVGSAQVSLLSDVQLVAAGHGLGEDAVGAVGPLHESLCTLTAAAGEPVIIGDTHAEERSRHLPLVTSGAARSYLGVPLLAGSGHVIGSLCVFDPAVHQWSPTDVQSLVLLARAVSTELELASLASDYRADRLRWGAAAEAGGVGSFDWVLPDGPLLWDDRLVSMFGYDGVEAFGHSIADFNARLHPDDLDRVTAALTSAIDRRAEFEAEYRICLPGGAVRWVQARGQTVTDAAGNPTHLLGAAYDTTDVHDGQARTGRILEAMPSGFLTMDTQWRFTGLNAAAEALLGSPRAELLGRTIWEAFPATVGTEFEDTYRATVASGTPTTLTAFYPAPLDAWFDILCWPTPDGLSLFFSDVTVRTRAEQQAAAAADRLALLARVADSLVNTGDLTDVLDELPRLLVPAVADGCVVTLLGRDGRARDVSSWHADPDLLPHLRGYAGTRLQDLPSDTPFAQALRAGTTRHVSPEQIAAVRMHPDARAHLDALGPTWGSIIPLRAEGRGVGALTLLSSTDRSRDLDTEAIAADIADRVGAAIHTHRLARARTQLAEDLQRSLLTAPPEPDHAEVVVRYLPASEAARVGGDWYDAFLQPDGCTMIVIGDVVGHDTVAAAAMGQIRGLLRGIATYSGAGPSEVLRGLDASMQVLQVNTLATAAVARFEQTPEEVERGVTRMVWANAGHPPPLVLNPDGTFQVLAPWKGDLLLGVDPTAHRTEQVAVLDRGATVLLYTDGLIERRDRDLDDGLLRLTSTASGLAGATLEELCDGLIQELVDGRPDDDVALVAVRLHPQDRPRPAEAGPQRIPGGVPEPSHPAQ